MTALNIMKRDIENALLELQRVYEDVYGKHCELSVDIDYAYTESLSEGYRETELTRVKVSCDVKL